MILERIREGTGRAGRSLSLCESEQVATGPARSTVLGRERRVDRGRFGRLRFSQTVQASLGCENGSLMVIDPTRKGRNHIMESLILAQNERWRRVLSMQVERQGW